MNTEELYRELTGHNSRQHKTEEPSTAFNYGRQGPWHEHGATVEYKRTWSLLQAMYARQMALSKATWALEMALKAVRDARDDVAYNSANDALILLRHEYDLLGIDNTRNVANMPDEPSDYRYGENI